MHCPATTVYEYAHLTFNVLAYHVGHSENSTQKHHGVAGKPSRPRHAMLAPGNGDDWLASCKAGQLGKVLTAGHRPVQLAGQRLNKKIH